MTSLVLPPPPPRGTLAASSLATRHRSSPSHDSLPSSVNLRSLCPDVYDQGVLNTCTANVLAADIEFVKMKQGQDQTGVPSRMDLYEQERLRAGRFPQDGGASIADGIAAATTNGVAPESDWPYRPSNLNLPPTSQVLSDRQDNRILAARQIDNTDLDQIKQSLADGYPVTCNFLVFPSFKSETTRHSGTIDMPRADEQPIGGHAVLLVGYDDSTHRFLVRNSTRLDDGKTPWGDHGYGTIPYQYIASTDLEYPGECWSVRAVGTGRQQSAAGPATS